MLVTPVDLGHMTPDPVVKAYWEGKKAFVAREADGYFSPAQYDKTFSDCRSKKRGLLGSGTGAIDNAFLLIAAEHIDLGLQHAKWGERFAQTAIEVGDLGAYQNWPPAFGLYTAYRSLHEANWLLGEARAEEYLKESLAHLAYSRMHHDAPNQGETADNKELDCWGYVTPFLIAGQVQEARHQFGLIYPVSAVNPKNLVKNSTRFSKVLGVLLDYLDGGTVPEELAEKTVEAYYANITGWGHEGTEPRATMWKELVRPQHVDFARIRSRYITRTADPIAVVRSIKGIG